jgi:hypothetical protein
MPERKISRRDIIKIIGGGIFVSTIPLTGCAAATVIVRIAPTLLRVGDVLLRVADGILTIQGIVALGSQVLDHQVSASEANSLKNGANLIIEDGSGKQFISAFGVYDDIGVVQPCDPSGTLTLKTQPANSARTIRNLSAGERLGVFDLRHSSGWYHVKTLGGEAGWIHGNCLKPLPRKSF